jgi:hypothetical protein
MFSIAPTLAIDVGFDYNPPVTARQIENWNPILPLGLSGSDTSS